MKKFSLALFLNLSLSTFFFFVLSLALFLSFFPYNVSLTLSITTALLFALIFYFFGRKIQNKKNQKVKETKNIDELFIELNFMSKQSAYSLFTKAFTSLNKTVIKVPNGLYIKEDHTLIFFAFSFEGISKADILKAYNMLKKEDKCLIYASFCSQENEKFITRFGELLKLENKKEIYSLLKETNNLPKYTHILLEETGPKPTLKNIFSKKKAKRFLTFGIVLIVMSFFVYYKLYYLIFGIMFLLLSSFSLLFGKEN